ncbi:MAG: hypothetical protein HKP05_01085 [Woeseiaceae bacterium]|nr:hypothetical protein [Gammaproteobacteria bacterium]NNK24218.1 hypothetical protein [Woeseiaceae bacterium]
MTDEALADVLNQSCHCIKVDGDRIRDSFDARLGQRGAWSRLQQTHPHLLADTPVFLSRSHIAGMQAIIDAIEHVVSLDSYRSLALGRAPDIARHDPGTHGVYCGYDFHLTNDGPRLIEVNTNAGGALLLMHLADAQQACCAGVENFVTGRVDAQALESSFVEMFREELRAQAPGRTLNRIAIVDEDPDGQYLSPEFRLFERMFEQRGIDTIVAEPDALSLEGGVLRAPHGPIDLVYNRLTDFYLETPACAALRDAFRDDAAVITPGPHTHALLANKRNLAVFSDARKLQALGTDAAMISTLTAGVPRTERVTQDNAGELWTRRRQLYFKPASGFGSRGTYSGAKLTRRKWESILPADYVAQQSVAPSERLVLLERGDRALKLDVRCYTYRGSIQLIGARLYRGQTTNFRTDGGGLAAVFTTPGVQVSRGTP